MKRQGFMKGKRLVGELRIERAFQLLMLLIVLVGLVNALRFGGASIYYHSVRGTIDAWQANSQVETMEEFARVKNAIDSANNLHSSHPLYMELAGQIAEWGVVSGFGKYDDLKDAKRYYLQALKVRPLWPATWANLAMVKWRLQEFDEEMLAYLVNANKYGPQSSEVHILFTRLGISLYNANNPMYINIKDIVHSRLQLGLRNPFSKGPILSYIEATHSLGTVCRWMSLKDETVAVTQLACT